jgi:TonB family protein
MNPRIPEPRHPPPTETIEDGRHHDPLKSQWNAWFWTSMSLAILLHFGLFLYGPTFWAEDFTHETAASISFDVPPEVDIPPPPPALARPAIPTIASAAISEDITIAPTTFESNPVQFLPPPPVHSTVSPERAASKFTPYTVAPTLLNRAQVEALLEAEYPPLLREAEVDGTVLIWLLIDTLGVPVDQEVREASGYTGFDSAALRVGSAMRFSPAYNRDRKTRVWVSLPIVFSVARDEPRD